jgi:hypothetical protein
MVNKTAVFEASNRLCVRDLIFASALVSGAGTCRFLEVYNEKQRATAIRHVGGYIANFRKFADAIFLRCALIVSPSSSLLLMGDNLQRPQLESSPM